MSLNIFTIIRHTYIAGSEKSSSMTMHDKQLMYLSLLFLFALAFLSLPLLLLPFFFPTTPVSLPATLNYPGVGNRLCLTPSPDSTISYCDSFPARSSYHQDYRG